MCNTGLGIEICVELYGFSPIIGAVFIDSTVVPKGSVLPISLYACTATLNTAKDYFSTDAATICGVSSNEFCLLDR